MKQSNVTKIFSERLCISGKNTKTADPVCFICGNVLDVEYKSKCPCCQSENVKIIIECSVCGKRFERG